MVIIDFIEIKAKKHKKKYENRFKTSKNSNISFPSRFTFIDNLHF
jgi:hypothetical protein